MRPSLPSAETLPIKPTQAERLRAWVDRLVAHIDQTAPAEYPSTWQEWGGVAIDDNAEAYGAEYGGRPDFVVADDAAWKG